MCPRTPCGFGAETMPLSSRDLLALFESMLPVHTAHTGIAFGKNWGCKYSFTSRRRPLMALGWGLAAARKVVRIQGPAVVLVEQQRSRSWPKAAQLGDAT